VNKRFLDPSIKRKDTIVKDKLSFCHGIVLPSIVEFNIFGNCNRNCAFCPVSNPEVYTKKNEGINIELFEKIAKDLHTIDYKGKILFSAFSEPLLHKNIEYLIVIAKKYLPSIRLEIVSNGDLLTAEKLKKLYTAGLDTINISMYDGKHQIEFFNTLLQDAGVPKETIILRRRYLENGNYGITISNRVGLVDSNLFRDEKEEAIVELPLKQPCYYPFYMTLIDYNGDVLLCPHDWNKSMKFGNLNDESFFDIWNSKVMNGIRKKLAKSDRNILACKNCDVLGTIMGKDSFEAWIN